MKEIHIKKSEGKRETDEKGERKRNAYRKVNVREK